MAAQLIAHYTPSEQITPNFYNHFTPVAAKIFPHFTPSEQTTLSLLPHFTPLGSSTLNSFYQLWRNYPLNLPPSYPQYQPSSYLILPPLKTNILTLTPNSTKFFPLQPIAAHFYIAILARYSSEGISRKFLPLQPTLTW